MKRRGAVFAVVALMMCVAVYLNWSYGKDAADYAVADGLDTAKTLGEAKYVDSQTPSEPGDAAEDAGYFFDARLTRQQARDEAIGILKQTAENEAVSADTRNEASEAITVMASNAVKEARIENLIKAKGYEDCVAFINDTGLSIIVSATETGLAAEDVAKIKDIAVGETSLSADLIKIVETD